MGKLIDLDEHRPHLVSEVICLKCLRRWIDVRPEDVPLKLLQCPYCRERGYVIETGERIVNAED